MDVSIAEVALAVSVLASAITALILRYARAAFLGQNFVVIMQDLQSPQIREDRALLYKNAHHQRTDQQAVDDWSEDLKASIENVCQMLDRAAIMARERMVSRRAIIDHFGPVYVDSLIGAAPLIAHRRRVHGRPDLWHNFVWLAKLAGKRYSRAELGSVLRELDPHRHRGGPPPRRP